MKNEFTVNLGWISDKSKEKLVNYVKQQLGAEAEFCDGHYCYGDGCYEQILHIKEEAWEQIKDFIVCISPGSERSLPCHMYIPDEENTKGLYIGHDWYNGVSFYDNKRDAWGHDGYEVKQIIEGKTIDDLKKQITTGHYNGFVVVFDRRESVGIMSMTDDFNSLYA